MFPYPLPPNDRSEPSALRQWAKLEGKSPAMAADLERSARRSSARKRALRTSAKVAALVVIVCCACVFAVILMLV